MSDVHDGDLAIVTRADAVAGDLYSYVGDYVIILAIDKLNVIARVLTCDGPKFMMFDWLEPVVNVP